MDPIDQPEPCPHEYGLLIKTYVVDTLQATLSVPCTFDDSDCLSQWPGINKWIFEL